MNHDLIVIGGGIAGSALAIAMAAEGAKVLVIETEARFQDRVRGEWLAPWGVAEAKRLRIYEQMQEAGAHELRYISGNDGELTDLQEMTRCHQPSLAFYHPAMQEALLLAAEQAGANVQRGVKARLHLENGAPYVETNINGHKQQLAARMVIGADGRNSSTRRVAGFSVQRDPDYLRIAGLLLDRMPAPDNAVRTWLDSWQSIDTGLYVLLFPQGSQRVRAYVSHLAAADYRLIRRMVQRSKLYCRPRGGRATGKSLCRVEGGPNTTSAGHYERSRSDIGRSRAASLFRRGINSDTIL